MARTGRDHAATGPTFAGRGTEAEIASRAARLLRWNTSLPRGAVRVRAADGKLMLEGEVEWLFQREAAARALRDVAGPSRLVNRIVVRALVPAGAGRQ